MRTESNSMTDVFSSPGTFNFLQFAPVAMISTGALYVSPPFTDNTFMPSATSTFSIRRFSKISI